MVVAFLLVRHEGLRSPGLPVGQAGLPSYASPYGRLGPLTTRGITGASRFTFVPLRVRVPALYAHKKTKNPSNDGFSVFGAP